MAMARSRRADRGAAGATPRMDPALREARTRYDHPTGWLGVDIADALVARWLITPGDEAGTVATPHGGRLGSSSRPSRPDGATCPAARSGTGANDGRISSAGPAAPSVAAAGGLVSSERRRGEARRPGDRSGPNGQRTFRRRPPLPIPDDGRTGVTRPRHSCGALLPGHTGRGLDHTGDGPPRYSAGCSISASASITRQSPTRPRPQVSRARRSSRRRATSRAMRRSMSST